MGRLTAALIVGMLAMTLSTGWGSRAGLGAARSSRTGAKPHRRDCGGERRAAGNPPVFRAACLRDTRRRRGPAVETDAHILREAAVRAGVDRKRIASTADGSTPLGRSRRRNATAWIPGSTMSPLLEQRRQDVSGGFLSTKRFEPNEADAIDAYLVVPLHEVHVRPRRRRVRSQPRRPDMEDQVPILRSARPPRTRPATTSASPNRSQS